MSGFNICYLNVGKHVQVACICIIIVNSFETLILAINILNTTCIYQWIYSTCVIGVSKKMSICFWFLPDLMLTHQQALSL